MHSYQADVQHAATTLIAGIFFEEQKLAELQRAHGAVKAELEDMAQRLTFLNLNPDLDDEGLGTSIYWEARFDVAPKADELGKQVQERQAAIEVRRFSAASLATALLQVAKHAMSLVNGGLQESPTGRDIGSQKLRAVVWQARNQAMHYEEQNLNEWVVNCFNTLAVDFGAHFSSFNDMNLAYEVVQLLGWSNEARFNEDLASLLPPAA